MRAGGLAGRPVDVLFIDGRAARSRAIFSAEAVGAGMLEVLRRIACAPRA